MFIILLIKRYYGEKNHRIVSFKEKPFLKEYILSLTKLRFSQINESAGISKSEFRNHKFFTIFGKYFRALKISKNIKQKCIVSVIFV